MQYTRSAWATAALLGASVALAGCGGGHSGTGANGTTNGGHPSTAPTSTPLAATHVASIAPRRLTSMAPITVTFRTALSPQSPLPTLHPAVPGAWSRSGSTAVFTPSQAYPPDSSITIKLAKLPGAPSKVIATRATPRGSLRRAEQILAHLHYIPLTTSAVTPTTTVEEAEDVYHPPAGAFAWRYADVPPTLKSQWSPAQPGQILRGAVIAFQHDRGLPVDGNIGPQTWAAMIKADLADKVKSTPYSYIYADLHIPQRLTLWVAGKTILTSPVNGGVPGAPTPLGTFPIYERLASTTMSGTNPSGSHYSDPGVPWVNYFSGGSAVHGFPRSSYGFPQSVGCLELPIPTAKRVFGLVDYGTLVHVAGPPVAAAVGKPAAPSGASSSPSSTPTPKSSPSHKAKH